MIRLPDCTLAAALLLPAAVHAQTQLQVEELVHVGPPAAEFAALTDVALTSAGALWIDDGMAGEVHLWVNGLLRQVSGTGDGPGEVRTGALELVAVGGDTVMVVEPGRARISVFAPGGAFVRALALEQVQGLTSGWRHVGGRLYARVNRQTMVQPGAGAPEGGDPVVVYDLGGRRVRDAAELPQSGGGSAWARAAARRSSCWPASRYGMSMNRVGSLSRERTHTRFARRRRRVAAESSSGKRQRRSLVWRRGTAPAQGVFAHGARPLTPAEGSGVVAHDLRVAVRCARGRRCETAARELLIDSDCRGGSEGGCPARGRRPSAIAGIS